MIILESHRAENLESSERLSDYLIGKFISIPTRKGIKKAIEKGQVLLNGQPGKTGDWVQKGDYIELKDIQTQAPKAYKLDLEILFEDEYMAIINKPAGIPVSGNQYRTIQNAVIGVLKESTEPDKLAWPKPVHRLDAATSGLLIIAKTYGALNRLGDLFARKEIRKTYNAIVVGKLEGQNKIKNPINGQEALTLFRALKSVPSLRNGHLTLVELNPITGRTHQLRIHLAEIGHPIFGDQLYGKDGEVFKGKGLFLSSVKLELEHPITGEKLKLEIPMPHKFKSLLDRENRRWRIRETEK